MSGPHCPNYKMNNLLWLVSKLLEIFNLFWFDYLDFVGSQQNIWRKFTDECLWLFCKIIWSHLFIFISISVGVGCVTTIIVKLIGKCMAPDILNQVIGLFFFLHTMKLFLSFQLCMLCSSQVFHFLFLLFIFFLPFLHFTRHIFYTDYLIIWLQAMHNYSHFKETFIFLLSRINYQNIETQAS